MKDLSTCHWRRLSRQKHVLVRRESAEEVLRFLTSRDAGKLAVLPHGAHAGMEHHQHQEACLSFRVASGDNGIDAVLLRSSQHLLSQPLIRGAGRLWRNCALRRPCRRTAVTVEAGGGGRRSVGTAVVLGDNLQVFACKSPIGTLIFNAQVGEPDGAINQGQSALRCP